MVAIAVVAFFNEINLPVFFIVQLATVAKHFSIAYISRRICDIAISHFAARLYAVNESVSVLHGEVIAVAVIGCAENPPTAIIIK